MFSSFGLGRLGLLQRWGGGGGFSPLSLSPTAWYDPSDLTTLFTTTSGDVPVASDGDVVGLALDKSQGLALEEERVAASASWTGSASWSVDTGTNTATLVNATASADQLTIGGAGLVGVTGEVFKATWTTESISGGGIRVTGSRLAGPGAKSTPGTYVYYGVFNPTGTGSLTLTPSNAGVSAVVSNMSVKKVSGHHLSQATTANKPLYKTSGGLHWIQGDGVDDYLSQAASSLTQPFSIMVAGKLDALVQGYPFTDATSATRGHYPYVNAINNWGLLATVIADTGIAADTNSHVFHTEANGASTAFSVDGAAPATCDPGSGGMTGLALLSNVTGGGNTYTNGRIYGLFARDTVLDAGELASLTAWMKAKAGVA